MQREKLLLTYILEYITIIIIKGGGGVREEEAVEWESSGGLSLICFIFLYIYIYIYDRILTLAFLCTIWTLLILFGALVQGSKNFRIWSKLETKAEKRGRVLGTAPRSSPL